MIKAKIISFTLSESIDSISKLDLETYLEDPVLPSSFYETAPAKGVDIVIMTEEEYKDMDSVSDGLRQSLLDEREKTKQLEETIKRLKERLAQEVAEVDLCPDATLVFRKKKVSELEKKVKELEEENKTLKKRIDIAMDFVDEVCSEVKELFDE